MPSLLSSILDFLKCSFPANEDLFSTNKFSPKDSGHNLQIKPALKSFLAKCLIPAISICSVAREMWTEFFEFLRRFPIKERFEVYEEAFTSINDNGPESVFSNARDIKFMKRFLKNLTDRKSKSRAQFTAYFMW